MDKKLSLCGSGINKQFPGVKACSNVSFETYRGAATSLIGVNGAGKSTLMNIIAGELPMDSGQLTLDGRNIFITDPRSALESGIALIHQEAMIFPTITVAENIFIKNLSRYIKGGRLLRRQMNQDAQELLDRVGCTLRPDQRMSAATVGERQLIEIARALSYGADVFLFDEPTSSLSSREKEKLFEIIRQMKEQDKTVIYITHFIDEVKLICDNVIVMRDGNVVGSEKTADVDVPTLISMMVGFSVEKTAKRRDAQLGGPILRVEGLRRTPQVLDVNFELKQGEILGLWGLMGSGRTETYRAMLGLDRPDSGSVSILRENGSWERLRGTQLLEEAGYVTENRHAGGIFGVLPIWKNITMPNLKRYCGKLFINEEAERIEGRRQVETLQIKALDETAAVGTLSGGNQQKVIMARWLSKGPDIFLLDEPTRGIDVNSKNFIYETINRLADSGCSLIIVSSEIEEIIDLCDRVVVISDGRTVGDLSGSEIDKISLMRLCVDRGGNLE